MQKQNIELLTTPLDSALSLYSAYIRLQAQLNEHVAYKRGGAGQKWLLHVAEIKRWRMHDNTSVDSTIL